MEITINDRTIQFADSWNELSLKKQLIAYGILMTDLGKLFQSHELIHAKRLMLMEELLGLDRDFLKLWRQDCINEYEEDGEIVFSAELADLLTAVDFLFDIIKPDNEEDPIRYQLKLGLTKCPWSQLQYEAKNSRRKRTWYAPADGLANISIYEMAKLFTLFEQFIETKNEQYADQLIAVMYRPSKPTTPENKQQAYQGDRRLPYLKHEGMLKKRQKKVAGLTKPVKQLLIFWFASCRQAIIDRYPKVFSINGGKSTGPDYKWGGVLMNLAGGLVNLDAIAAQNHNNALTYLSMLEDQRRQRELELAESKFS